MVTTLLPFVLSGLLWCPLCYKWERLKGIDVADLGLKISAARMPNAVQPGQCSHGRVGLRVF